MDEARAKSNLFKGDDMIVITLENVTRTFTVQKALLCNVSRYFVSALKGNFQESKSRSLKLPGCDVETLECFIYWLCERKIPIEDDSKLVKKSVPIKTSISSQQILLAKLWMFGDAFLIPKFQNDVMRQLGDRLSVLYPRVEIVQDTLTKATGNCILRKAIIWSVVHSVHSDANLGIAAYKTEDLDAMGAIPGFVADLVQEQSICKRVDCYKKTCTRRPVVGGQLQHRYKMPEE